jgi:hypothetical protein
MCVTSHQIIKVLTRFLTTFFLLSALTVSAFAATVRGKLQDSQQQPKGYVAVTLYSSRTGRSAAVYTGADGMYYLHDVPAGEYFLEVWLYANQPPLTYKVTITDPGTDIPPIQLP